MRSEEEIRDKIKYLKDCSKTNRGCYDIIEVAINYLQWVLNKKKEGK